MKDDILLGDTPKARKRRKRAKALSSQGRLWKHSTLRDIEGVISPDQLSDLFSFTLVRNPWDRIVSYYHWLRVQKFDHPAVSLSQKLDFQSFVLHPSTLASFRKSPASAYMRRTAGAEQCDLYIRIEHFREDVGPLIDHLGFSFELPHLNRSTRAADFRHYYRSATAEAVADACSEDIRRFGYQFSQ